MGGKAWTKAWTPNLSIPREAEALTRAKLNASRTPRARVKGSTNGSGSDGVFVGQCFGSAPPKYGSHTSVGQVAAVAFSLDKVEILRASFAHTCLCGTTLRLCATVRPCTPRTVAVVHLGVKSLLFHASDPA